MERIVFTDDRGVWSLGSSGKPYGYEWDEIYSVAVSKVDTITEVYTGVILDTEYGEFFEFDDGCKGFADAVDEITKKLPGMPSNWMDVALQLSIEDPPVDVWTRQAI